MHRTAFPYSAFTRRFVALGVSLALAGLAGCASTARGPDSGLASNAEPREQTADQQVKQAVQRLTFGPTPGEIAQVSALGVDRWVALQLRPERIRDTTWERVAPIYGTQSATTRALADSNPPQDLWVRQLRKARGLPDTAQFVMTPDDSAHWKVIATRTNKLAGEILSARVARAQLSDRQLLEVMTDFWENHFSVYAGKMPTRFTLLEYDRDVIRPRALGKFRDLLGAVAKSPAMLYYLDNYQSAADAAHRTLAEWRAAAKAEAEHKPAPPRHRRGNGLNENYGRELMELHTLGVDGGYTQHDVIDAARALTGWTLQDARAGGGFLFRPEAHDAESKVVLGHTLAAGRGIEDGEEVLDIVARHPATARFLATKLVRHFVSDSAPAALVEQAAATFTRTDGDIRAVMRTILFSGAFYSRAAYKAKVKTPFELVVSVRRALNAAPDSTAATANQIARLGEPVFGHLAPNGYPDVGDAWMNTGAILDRINFGLAAALGRSPGMSLDRWSPSWTLAYAPSAEQVDGVIAALLEGEASPDTRGILITGENPLAKAVRPDSTAAPAMARSVVSPMATVAASSAPGSSVPRSAAPRLAFANLVGLALGSPEFQRR